MIQTSRTDDKLRRSIHAAWGGCVLAWLCIIHLGCGSGEYTPGNDDMIAEAVSHISDAAAEPESFQALFVDGTAPPEAQRKRYRKYTFDAADVAVAGDTATVQVSIISPFDDQSVGEAEWTCARAAGQWRLQNAPLPDSLP